MRPEPRASRPPGQRRWEIRSPGDRATPRRRAIRAPSPYNKVTQPEPVRADGPPICSRVAQIRAGKTSMLNSLDLEGRPQDTRVVVAMSGGVDSSVTAALLKAEGYDVVGVTLQLYDHGAATHRKGACCAGQDIHDARAVAERIGIPHYVLDYESRFKEVVIDRFAESYVAGETPVPCVECNQSIKFRDLLRPRASSAPRCWRPAITSPRGRCPVAAARSTAPATRSATRAISCSPPRASSSTCCAFRSASATKAETRELARRLRPAGRRQARQPGHLLRAVGPLHRGDRAAQAGRRRARRHRRSRRPRARRAMTASSISRSASGAGSASRPAIRSTWCGSTPRRAASSSGRARRCAPAGCGCATSTGWARARSIRRLCAGWHEVFVKVRSTRPPQPAWLSRGAERHRGRSRRRRGRRLARPGLRVLRRGRRPGARARRRLHPERGRRDQARRARRRVASAG